MGTRGGSLADDQQARIGAGLDNRTRAVLKMRSTGAAGAYGFAQGVAVFCAHGG